MGVSGFDDRNIQGMFYGAYEDTFAGSYADQLGMVCPSNSAQETYGFLGANPAMREWIGERQAQVLNKKQYTITNKSYEASMEIAQSDLQREKTGLLQRRMSTFASDAGADHWQQLLVDLINANGACYDGISFFSASHVFGDSGTQVNELGATQVPSSNVAVTTAPTPTEFANCLLEAIGFMMTYKNDKGRLINGQARKFLIQVSTQQLFSAAVQATTGGMLSTNVANPLNGMMSKGYSFEVQMEPRITSATDKFNLYRTDGGMKPFILQDEKAVETDILGPGSDHWFRRKAYLLGVDARRAVGYGLWEYASRITLT
jgi:phage major head subunit gpT-like protein